MSLKNDHQAKVEPKFDNESITSDITESSDSARSSRQQPKFIQALKSMFVWYPANYDMKERQLLFKLDLSILIYACLSFFCKFLDQSNINNAYVSGLKEDFSMYGNELNWLNISYLSGYVLMQIPFLLLISRPRLSKYVLPCLELGYAVLTLLQSQAHNTRDLYALRFFIGALESPSFLGVHYCLGRFYGSESYRGNPPELHVRAGTWFLCSSAGSMFSGYVQAAVLKNPIGSLNGWRSLFVVDAIVTIFPVAVLGFLFWPGLPESGKPWYLTQAEYDIVLERTQRNKIATARKIDRSIWWSTLKSWHIYVFTLSYISMLLAYYPTNYLNLWMKAQGSYTVYQINTYPTVNNAVTIVASFVGTALAAVYDPRIIYMFNIAGGAICCIIMTIYHVSTPAVFAAFWISGLAGCGSPILYSTINKILRHDQEKKAIVMGTMMAVGYFVYTWAPLGLFPTAESYGRRAAPEWVIGWPVSLAFTILLGSLFFLTIYLYHRDLQHSDSKQEDEHLDVDSEKLTKTIGDTVYNKQE